MRKYYSKQPSISAGPIYLSALTSAILTQSRLDSADLFLECFRSGNSRSGNSRALNLEIDSRRSG